MAEGFSPVDRRMPAVSQIYRGLRTAILRGHLAPGSSLSEKEVAQQFATSRTPAREAFIRLSKEGLVEIAPQYGTFVSRISLAAVHDSQLVREAVETVAAAKAAERMTTDGAAELDRWVDLQAAAVSAGDPEAFVEADDGMHAALLRIAGHPGVWKVVHTAKAHLDRVRYLAVQDRQWLQQMLDQHRAIVAQARVGDAAATANAMRTHLRTVFEAIERIAAEGSDVFASDGAGLPS